MELKLKGDIFYLLDTGDEKRIFDSESEAVSSLRNVVSKREEIDPETLSIWEVNTAGEKWKIKAVPWSKIAIELMRGGKKNE